MAEPSLDLFAVFARVAESGSFSRAARELSLSKATVSKRVTELEAALGVALLARTTRRAALTEAGQRVLARAQRILEEAQAAQEEAVESRASPKGRLRIAAPMSFAQRYLADVLPEFLDAYPDIELDLSLEDRVVDVIGEGFDAALRIRPLEDSSMMARKLAPVRLKVVAAPSYWDAHGRPQTPADLERHSAFVYSNVPNGSVWKFQHLDGRTAQVRVRSRALFNNAEIILPSLMKGHGVAMHPDFHCWRDIAEGRLEAVLEDWCAHEMWLHLLTPSMKGAPRKTRAFSDFVHAKWGGGKAPWLAPARRGKRA